MPDHITRCGSMWNRWDPHIHAPGTVLNDLYNPDTGWESFIYVIENSSPVIRALGVTDYYSTDCYEAVRAYKDAGRLPDVDLIFPNVELRLAIGSDRGSPIDLHLLVSPEDRDHLSRLHAFLTGLEFHSTGQRFSCNPQGITRLGYHHDPNLTTDRRALEVGTNQFKVTLDNLVEQFDRDQWAQNNILVAVPAGRTAGTAGLQGDASLARLRREIERNAQIIFSGNPSDRTFWLGRGGISKTDLDREYNGSKPCLHGCDAHTEAKVARPDKNRFCWLKGDVTFETLKQSCLEPEGRAFVAEAPPTGPIPSKVISSIRIEGAGFFDTSSIELNPGMIGVIGARGSGKTALADLIAAGAHAFFSKPASQSFLTRASNHLAEAEVVLSWKDGSETRHDLSNLDEEESDYPQVRYLSQQFVEKLCSSEGMTDELLQEIQRVIFEAHDPSDRCGATDFNELLSLRAERFRNKQVVQREILADLSRELTAAREKVANVSSLEQQKMALKEQMRKDEVARRALIAPGGEERAEQFNAIASAYQAKKTAVEQISRRVAALKSLKVDVNNLKSQVIPEEFRQLQSRNKYAKITSALWPNFKLKFEGDVDKIIEQETLSAVEELNKARGPAQGEPVLKDDAQVPTSSFIADGIDLASVTLSLLKLEATRLEKLIGVDRQKARTIAQLSQKMTTAEAQLAKIERELEEAKAAPGRINEIVSERSECYRAIFSALLDEENELKELYKPLQERLNNEQGTIRKLTFQVRRKCNLKSWADEGEELIDARKGNTFRGKGAIFEAARKSLVSVWENGSVDEVADAMSNFRETYDKALWECCPFDRTKSSEAKYVRDWASEISSWLYATDHIQITYGIQYDGVEIERLSPGTRGIVLLLLYLDIDLDDDRPLIIDQPEENLDPKSIFDELVTRFRSAKQRRQIIIVTHNANLIVNTDVDQVVIAKCSPREHGCMPQITYETGGLENHTVRMDVCNILEGGAAAFKERAKRLRVRLGS